MQKFSQTMTTPLRIRSSEVMLRTIRVAMTMLRDGFLPSSSCFLCSAADRPYHLQDFHEIKITLRVPCSARPQAEMRPADSSSGTAEAGDLPETAVGVSGIELREQTHEEALLSTLGEPLLACAWLWHPCGESPESSSGSSEAESLPGTPVEGSGIE